jgi:hypothetical protein
LERACRILSEKRRLYVQLIVKTEFRERPVRKHQAGLSAGTQDARDFCDNLLRIVKPIDDV